MKTSERYSFEGKFEGKFKGKFKGIFRVRRGVVGRGISPSPYHWLVGQLWNPATEMENNVLFVQDRK